MEELVYLAGASGRALVEPHYLFGARNWSWFEHGGRNARAGTAELSAAVVGTVSQPLGAFFRRAPLEAPPPPGPRSRTRRAASPPLPPY